MAERFPDGRVAHLSACGDPSRRVFLRTGALAGLAAALAACNISAPRAQSFERKTLFYGLQPQQVGDLLVPLTGARHPVVVVIHGGYWRAGLGRAAMTPVVDALGRLGYAVWNIDYRVLGEGGGFPATFEDVALAVDHVAALAADEPIDSERVAVIGHSAGGQLAFWAAARAQLPSGAVGAAPTVQIDAAVSLAGVLDLAAAVDTPTGPSGAELRDAVIEITGGTPTGAPDRYAQLSPIARVPLGIPQLIIHGDQDDTVPIDQSRAYVRAATAAGDTVRLAELPGGDHLEVARHDRPSWEDTVRWLIDRVPVPR